MREEDYAAGIRSITSEGVDRVSLILQNPNNIMKYNILNKHYENEMQIKRYGRNIVEHVL